MTAIETIAIIAFAIVWAAIWWRLRGGAFTALTGFDPGTGGMRAIAAVGMGGPLMAFSWFYATMIPVLWITWSLAGWGAFQGMNKPGSGPVVTSNPVAIGLIRCGFGDLAVDVLGMAIEGGFCVAIASLVPAALTGDWLLWAVCVPLGWGFGLIYFTTQRLIERRLPNLGRFASGGQEWGEVLVGALFGGLIIIEVLQ